MNFLNTLVRVCDGAKKYPKEKGEENRKKKLVRAKGKPKMKQIIRKEKEGKAGRINKYRN